VLQLPDGGFDKLHIASRLLGRLLGHERQREERADEEDERQTLQHGYSPFKEPD